MRDGDAVAGGAALRARAARDRRARTVVAIARYLEECAASPLVLDMRRPALLAAAALRELARAWPTAAPAPRPRRRPRG